VHGKAAALLHSLTSNDALVDGNKRLAWATTAVFLWINGHDLDAPEDGAFDQMIAVADGSLSDVEKIAERLAGWSTPRPA
jgi:death-on-curing protein